MPEPVFEMLRDGNLLYCWRLRDERGKVIAQGNWHRLRADCMREIERVQTTDVQTKIKFIGADDE